MEDHCPEGRSLSGPLLRRWQQAPTLLQPTPALLPRCCPGKMGTRVTPSPHHSGHVSCARFWPFPPHWSGMSELPVPGAPSPGRPGSMFPAGPARTLSKASPRSRGEKAAEAATLHRTPGRGASRPGSLVPHPTPQSHPPFQEAASAA